MKFHPDKCKVVTNKHRPSPLAMLPFVAYHYHLGENLLSYADSEKDLGVLVNKSFNFNEQCGSETKSPLETAEVLADFFHSVFQPEPFGPLPKDCYSKRSKVLPESDFLFNYFLENELLVHPESVTKLLKELDVNKSMGPDGVHPKLIKYLSQDQSFVDAIVLLFRACITERCIPEVWKTAIVVALHKKGSVHNPNEYGGGPTTFLYMATRFLPNVHVQKCTKMYKICFFLFGSSLDRYTCCG